jgi:outer membrane protein assembly factor BamB
MTRTSRRKFIQNASVVSAGYFVAAGFSSPTQSSTGSTVQPTNKPQELPLGTDWPVGRGNSTSTGVATGKITERPEVLWEFKTNSEKSGFEGTPVIADGRVFVGDFEGTMHAIELGTGKELWSVKTKDGFVTAAAVHKGKVVIGDFSGQVYCFDTSTGNQIWAREIEQQVASGANFFEENVLLTSESGSMIALDLNTGEPKWSYATGDQLRSSPTIWKTFSLLGGCDGRLHKIDLKAGSAIGDGVPLDAPTLSTPSIVGNIAIVPTQPGVVFAIDVETDKVLWTFSDPAQCTQGYDRRYDTKSTCARPRSGKRQSRLGGGVKKAERQLADHLRWQGMGWSPRWNGLCDRHENWGRKVVLSIGRSDFGISSYFRWKTHRRNGEREHFLFWPEVN